MIKGIAALSIVLAILLALSHPSPFRTPDYLEKRTRWNDTLAVTDLRQTYGRFGSDSLQDHAYVNVDNGAVEIRFDHLLPTITLSEKFDRVSHIETVPDLNSDGNNELYFIAVEKQSCNAVGILTHYVDGKWIELKSLSQYGCNKEYPDEHCVTNNGSGQYYIIYHLNGNDEEQSFRGQIPGYVASR